MAHQFVRSFSNPKLIKEAIRAAKKLDIRIIRLTAQGRWRSLHPSPTTREYEDFMGPFTVRQGVLPAFLRDDGTEVFMVDDTSRALALMEVDSNA